MLIISERPLSLSRECDLEVNIVWVSVLLPGHSLEQGIEGLWGAFLPHLMVH